MMHCGPDLPIISQQPASSRLVPVTLCCAEGHTRGASSERAARAETNNLARPNHTQDRNGRIDRDEIRTALANWNMPPAPHELDAIFSACDVTASRSNLP